MVHCKWWKSLPNRKGEKIASASCFGHLAESGHCCHLSHQKWKSLSTEKGKKTAFFLPWSLTWIRALLPPVTPIKIVTQIMTVLATTAIQSWRQCKSLFDIVRWRLQEQEPHILTYACHAACTLQAKGSVPTPCRDDLQKDSCAVPPMLAMQWWYRGKRLCNLNYACDAAVVCLAEGIVYLRHAVRIWRATTVHVCLCMHAPCPCACDWRNCDTTHITQ